MMPPKPLPVPRPPTSRQATQSGASLFSQCAMRHVFRDNKTFNEIFRRWHRLFRQLYEHD
ncbi:hypothetical protein CORC01_07192 [Colletotrichum orchidophilum]|uniref:Transposase n=1 Tax=Colletotrichum orchidophilum TaxID=1209926 RepID=A0A1G4B837_9PEZI|nr:uncharacterized protein CORC01_07192 [Colletotrichum orchidophilum]OHE97577.1 hypothetical protein CORC01_07192 [Colletotrichum orchidophilum]